MTALLVRLFIKDYKAVEKNSVRTKYSLLASIVGIFCNIALFVTKFIIGILINSISVTTDAFNNLSDAGSSIISFIGAKLANRPPDKEHPFGHGRFEYISALIVSFLILQVGFTCIKNSFMKILNPEDMKFSLLSLIFLVLSVGIKLWLGLFNKKLSQTIQSPIMKATAVDSFSDVGITSATILSILISKLFGFNIDGYIGLIVSGFVIIAGINVAKDTIEPLLGEAVDIKLYKKITTLVESYDNIIGSHDLIVHSYGPSHTMATIHAEVPNDLNFEQAHETIDQIERDFLKKYNIFLVIHMDPVSVNDQVISEYKQLLLSVILKVDKTLSIHDFRMTYGESQINLIFDLVVPHSFSDEDVSAAVSNIKKNIANSDPKCLCHITVEHSYVAYRSDGDSVL